MPSSPHTYEVLAIKYASVNRPRSSNFLEPVEGDPDAPMPLDFYVWLVRGHGEVVLVDTGFSAVSAIARQRVFLKSPLESLRALGVDAASVRDVVITHLHYDHAGNVHEFPHSKVWLQQREMAYATGQCMCDVKQNHFFALDDIAVVLKRLYEGDVGLIDGMHELASGIELHRIGGHTDGLQVVRVRTRKGWVVLASDAAHYYENLEKKNPFPAIFSRADMMRGYEVIEAMASSPALIVPGHDPQVGERFPRLAHVDAQVFVIA